MDKRWLLIGGGPSAKHNAGLGDFAQSFDMVAACNEAINWVPNPTWYFCTDPANITRRYAAGMKAKKLYGTVIWSTDGWMGRDKDIPYDTANVRNYSRDKIAHARTIGTIMLQVCLMEGAKDITLIGYDGYGVRKELDFLMADVFTDVLRDRTDIKVEWLGDSWLRDTVYARLGRAA